MLKDYDDEDEENEVEEQETKPVRSKSSASTLDPGEFADALISRMQRSAPAKVEPDRDEVQETIQFLRNEGYSDDYIKANYASLKSLESKIERKIEARLRETDEKRKGEALIGEAKAYISMELRQIFKEAPELKEFEPEIRVAIDNQLIGNTQFWQKMGAGKMDTDTIASAIEKAEKKYSKLLGGSGGERKNVNVAMRTAAPGNNTKAKAQMKESDEEVDTDKLSDHQLTAFNAFYNSNRKRFDMSDEEARKDAYFYASKLPEKYRSKKSVYEQ